MNLKHLTDEVLDQDTKRAAQNERLATTVLLHHLMENETRKLFAKHGCDSVFEYCVQILNMSHGHAARRISAMRLMRVCPQVEEKLESGKLNLTALSQAEGFFKLEAKAGNKYSVEAKAELIDRIENLPTREIERVLIQRSSQPDKIVKETARVVSRTQTELNFAVTNETFEKLERLKKIWSHDMPYASFDDLISRMAEVCIEKFDPVRKALRSERRKSLVNDSWKGPMNNLQVTAGKDVRVTAGKDPQVAAGKEVRVTARTDAQVAARDNLPVACIIENPSPAPDSHLPDSVLTPEPVLVPVSVLVPRTKNVAPQPTTKKINRTRYIPAAVRHVVWIRDGGACTFHDSQSVRKCGSTHQLQLDHVVPFSFGGANSVANLRLRCAAHNRLHALEIVGRCGI